MDFLNNKKNQILITLLYPVIIFSMLSIKQTLDSWFIPVIVTIVFCLLWGNLRYLMISTILMWVTAVPIWWLLIERSKEGQGAVIFTSSLPFIILVFIGVVLIPEILMVTLKNIIINKFVRR